MWSFQPKLTQISIYYSCKFNQLIKWIQFWFRFIPVNRSGQIFPTLTAISPTPTLHLAWFKASYFSNQHSFSPPLASFTSSLVIFTSSFHSLQIQRFSQNMPIIPPLHMPVPSHISLHSPLLSEPLFPSIWTSPLGPLN